MGAEQAAWGSPIMDAGVAAASVLQQANGQSGFNLPPALSKVVNAVASMQTKPVASSPQSSSVPLSRPAPDPGIVGRVVGWVQDHKVLALGIVAAVVGGWLLLRKRG